MEEDNFSDDEILEANIRYHSILVDSYDVEQPHFKPENIQRETETIRQLASSAGNDALLDMGCGTGFVINIAKKFFKRLCGVDITQKMLDKIDTSSGNIELCLQNSAQITFPDNSFNVVTAYGFLHHLPSLEPTFREAYRLLKKAGIFYSNQDPNYYYWELMKQVHSECQRHADKMPMLSPVLEREIKSVVAVCDELQRNKIINESTIAAAEYLKILGGGFKVEELLEVLNKIGFEATVRYEWFLGKGYILHNRPGKELQIVEQYLREGLPATRSLFKYLSIKAIKR